MEKYAKERLMEQVDNAYAEGEQLLARERNPRVEYSHADAQVELIARRALDTAQLALRIAKKLVMDGPTWSFFGRRK